MQAQVQYGQTPLGLRMLTLLLYHENHQAPQGPDRKDMTYLKKKKKTRRGEWKQLPPHEGIKKRLCFTSLSQRQLQGQFMCERQRHFDTVSFCHWSYQWLLARSRCSKAACLSCACVDLCVRETARRRGLLCVTWCLEAFMIMIARSSPTKTYQ